MGGAAIYDRYLAFRRDLPPFCSELRLDIDDLTFLDFSRMIARWLRLNG